MDWPRAVECRRQKARQTVKTASPQSHTLLQAGGPTPFFTIVRKWYSENVFRAQIWHVHYSQRNQDDYKNVPVVKDKIPVKKDAKHDTKPRAMKPTASSRPPCEAAVFKPKPRASNSISSEFEKKEYFDTKEVLEMKINQLADWLRQSRYCIVCWTQHQYRN